MASIETVEPSPGEPRITAAGRIMRAARDLFYRRGIRAIGVDEIVRQAGVTKPSLYRSFASKDELAASYLRGYEQEFWSRFDKAVAKHPGDARAGLLHYLEGLSVRAGREGYRGCGLSNAAVEYPEPDHPARLVSEAHKHAFRTRLRAMAREMGAADPDELGDGLLLLIEGAFISGQIFDTTGPAASVARSANKLIAAHLGR